MNHVYNREEELMFVECQRCKGMMELPCKGELYDMMKAEEFSLSVMEKTDDERMKHAVTLGLCDCCFKDLKEDTKKDGTEE